MSVEKALEGVLARLSDAQLEALANGVSGLNAPSAELGRYAAGAGPGAHKAISALLAAWTSAPALTGDGVALALRTGLRARRAAADLRSRPVWTGPGAVGDQRLTGAVLHELVAHARERVLLVSFAAYTLAELAADLHDAVQRNCEVDLVFETEKDSAGAYSEPKSVPFSGVVGARRWRWPADNRKPGAVLHAKLLVVDGCRALVGSANLTHRALTANLEAGVLIEDPDLAGDLEAHVRSLMNTGALVAARDA